MRFLLCLRYPKLKYTIFMYSTLLLFVTSTVLLFLYLNDIQPYYFIDEAFHIPQTLQYCAWNFTQVKYILKLLMSVRFRFGIVIYISCFQWDPKITTLPGLYLITTAILSPFNLCDIIYVRCMNLIGTCLNIYLTYNIIKENSKSNETNTRWNTWLILALAYNITLFPPLYFWCFFFYTDVASVNAVLLMLLLHRRKCTWMTVFIGMYSTCSSFILWLWDTYMNVISRRFGGYTYSPDEYCMAWFCCYRTCVRYIRAPNETTCPN